MSYEAKSVQTVKMCELTEEQYVSDGWTDFIVCLLSEMYLPYIK